MAQIREILRQLLGQQHALVDQRPVRQAGQIPVFGAIDGRGANLAVGAFARHVQAAFEIHAIDQRGRTADEYLAHEGLAGARGFAQARIVDRHRAPAQHREPRGLHDVFEGLFQLAALGRIARQKHQSAPVLAGLRQRDARLLGRVPEKCVRHLHQHAGAVAGVDLAAARAAMIQILQDLNRLLQDAVGFAALDVYDEADAAGVLLELWVVQTLLRRRTEPRCPLGHGTTPYMYVTHPTPVIPTGTRRPSPLSRH